MSVLNKADFCMILSKLENENEFIDKLNDIFSRYNRDVRIYDVGLEGTVIELLETIFQDKEGEWISYWCYELKFGKSYEDGAIKELDGTIIPLRTSEELYDFLIKNMENKNEQL